MRKIKTLFSVNDISFTMLIMLLILICIPIEFQLRANSVSMIDSYGQPCVYEAYIVIFCVRIAVIHNRFSSFLYFVC